MTRPPAIATYADDSAHVVFDGEQRQDQPTSATADPTDKSKLRVTISMTALIAARLTIDV